MAWSYTTSDLATSQKDQVRLLIGDTQSARPLLQDEEIAFHISQRSSIWGAAAECCRSIQAIYSYNVDQSAGDTSLKYSQRAKAYGIKAAEFEQKATAIGAGMPYAGGISIVDKLSQQTDSDRVMPQFQIGMDDDLLPIPSAGNETIPSGSTGGE